MTNTAVTYSIDGEFALAGWIPVKRLSVDEFEAAARNPRDAFDDLLNSEPFLWVRHHPDNGDLMTLRLAKHTVDTREAMLIPRVVR